MHNFGPLNTFGAFLNLSVQQSVDAVHVKDEIVLCDSIQCTSAASLFQRDPGASVLNCPVAASSWEGIIEVIPPFYASEESHSTNKGQSADEDNEDDVNNPENSVPSVALFLLFNHLLGAEDFRRSWNELSGLSVVAFVIVLNGAVGIHAAVTSLLVLNVEVQVQPTRNDADDRHAQPYHVDVVD